MAKTILSLNSASPSHLEEITPKRIGQITEKGTIRDFNATQQAQLFKRLRESQFSGQLRFKDRQGNVSIFFLFLGRIVFCSGGIHPVRRWNRNLTLYCHDLIADVEGVKRDVKSVIGTESLISWQYDLLSLWVKQEKLNREQIYRLIRGITEEVLFDLTQVGKVRYELKPDKFFSNSTPLVLIKSEEIIAQVWKFWQAWQNTKLADFSPNLAPIIENEQQLVIQLSPLTAEMLQQNLDGKTTLRDLAVQLRQNLLQMSRSLLIYVEWGLVGLKEIEDLDDPEAENSEKVGSKSVLVAYLDDSSGMTQRMKHIILKAGYKFLSIKKSSDITDVCLDKKPNFIFMNMKMSNLDYYHTCVQLRQLDVLHQTPIFLMSHNISMLAKIRAKMAGISDLTEILAPPEVIISLIEKYLHSSDSSRSNSINL